MNFEEFFINEFGKDNSLAERSCKPLLKMGWKASKKEVLKIITDKLNHIGWTASPDIIEIMKQIGKL